MEEEYRIRNDRVPACYERNLDASSFEDIFTKGFGTE